VTSYINRFQRFHDVGVTSVIAGATAVSRDVEICAEPAFEVNAPQHTMAGWEVDLAIPKIISVGDVLRSQSGALSIFVIIRWFSIRRKFNAAAAAAA
jgi:hypothetical protein